MAVDAMTIAAILRQVPFFSHMSDEELDRLYQGGKEVSLQKGEVVVHEGDVADYMYVVLEGEVSVNKVDNADHPVTIATLGIGDFFGEMALLQRLSLWLIHLKALYCGPGRSLPINCGSSNVTLAVDQGTRSATVVCQVPCRLFVLNQEAFRILLSQADTGAVYRLFAALTYRVRDTTERVLREELAKQALEAETEIERHRSLAQMVAGVAHEINSPLGIVNTAASLVDNRIKAGTIQTAIGSDLRAASDLEDILEASALIQSNIARAHKLIQDFKKISVNQLSHTRETVNLPETVRSSVDLFRINARKAKLPISIEDHLPEDERIWLGYPGALTQVLMNLLTNIERYAYTSDVDGEVNVALSTRGNGEEAQFALSVRDYGKGIPPENLPRIFEPFFTTGRSIGGTGLGLAIVYNIVTSMFNGEIQVSSEAGKGTTFTIVFPQTAPERS
jgi:signal transduction histidine kinase